MNFNATRLGLRLRDRDRILNAKWQTVKGVFHAARFTLL